MRKLALTLAVGAGTLFAQSDKEAALGKYMAAQFSKSVTPLDNPEVQNYIDRLATRLSGSVWHVTVTSDINATHEAISFPGGYLFVPAPLILSTQSEAEFAGMLARAMTPFRLVTPATGSIPVVYTAPFALEADRNAVQMMAAAGYDPSALLDYVSRTARGRAREERTAAITAAIRGTAPLGEWEVSTAEFARIRAELTPASRRPPPSLYH